MKKRKNEKNTENLFRRMLANKGYSVENGYIIDEQISSEPNINKLLMLASKSGNGEGKPEFIITHPDYPDLLIVVECKADILKHESSNRDKYAEFAVDGVLLYASYLKKEYNVIAIALSGESEKNYKFNSFLILKNIPFNVVEINNLLKDNYLVNELLTFENYDDILHDNNEKKKSDLNSILHCARKLHSYIYKYLPIEEAKKTLLVSAIILGLENKNFRESYLDFELESDNRICEELQKVIAVSLKESGMPKDKIILMKEVFRFIIADKDILQTIDDNTKKSKISYMIELIEKEVTPFIKRYAEIDFIGHFYNEFIRYTGGDGKGLGIVLTPKHITEFMCDLIEINKDSIVLDTCTGTAAFLISAMYKMIEDIKSSNLLENEKEIKIAHIKEKQLIGVEQNPRLFTMAACNLYFKGDGKTNLIYGDCFNQLGKLIINDKDDNGKEVTIKPNCALINPPYSQKNDKLKEIDFISFTLDQLSQGGRLACIVPMSVAIQAERNKAVFEVKKNILSKHRLDAVFSMPNDLFYPVGTNTCIMVFTAYTKHTKDFETFFAYLKEDGHKITRKGRVDQGNWNDIENEFITLFKNKKNIAGKSVCKAVTAQDEWCAEAYMETNFKDLDVKDFTQVINQYLAFNLLNKVNNYEAR